MRSISRSLTLYFLALLTVGLGVIALVIDRAAGRTLEARRDAASKLIETQHEDRHSEVTTKRDNDLSNEARELYSQMQLRYNRKFDEENKRFGMAMSMTDGLLALSPWTRFSWSIAATKTPAAMMALRHYFSHLELADGLVLPTEGEPDSHPGLYQVNIASRTKSLWRSKSLGEFKFTTDETSLDATKLFTFQYDTIAVGGLEYRHVVLKAPLLSSWGANRFPQRPPTPRIGPGVQPLTGPPAPTGPPAFPQDRTPETIPRTYVHCARPIVGLDGKLAALTADRDRQQGELAASIDRDRLELRLWLGGIGGAFFLGVLIGGPLLIRRGLAPVHKLSVAVGRVSERDFKLPIEPADLSRELLPIHARLTLTLDALRRAFDREKQAVADISHELRTPIAALLVTLDVSLRKTRTSEQYRTTLEESRSICVQLGKLVERIMTLAWLDAGNDAIQPAPVDLVELAEGCTLLIRPLAAEKGLEFTPAVDGPVEVVTDPDKLREVVMNLLHNAVEYNRPGGTVTLAVRATPDRGAVVEVTDTGIGMSPEIAGRIFERFFRADPSRHAAASHAGLGLAIVKEYLERVGGSIAVESRPGVGTTFRVTLPAICPGCPPESEAALTESQLVPS